MFLKMWCVNRHTVGTANSLRIRACEVKQDSVTNYRERGHPDTAHSSEYTGDSAP